MTRAKKRKTAAEKAGAIKTGRPSLAETQNALAGTMVEVNRHSALLNIIGYSLMQAGIRLVAPPPPMPVVEGKAEPGADQPCAACGGDGNVKTAEGAKETCPRCKGSCIEPAAALPSEAA